MSMFTLYMLLKLDTIQAFFGIFMGISIMIVFVSILGTCLEAVNSLILKKLIKIFIPLGIVCAMITTLIPTTKEMAFIYVASKISNTEKGKNIGENMLNIPDNALEIVNIKMKEYLEDMKKETIKKVTK